MSSTRAILKRVVPLLIPFALGYGAGQFPQASNEHKHSLPREGIQKKVVFFGTGKVTRECLASLVKEKIAPGNQLKVILYNPMLSHAEGLLMDAKNSLPVETTKLTLEATNQMQVVSEANLIVITAGKFPSEDALEKARKKGTDRELQSVINYPMIAQLGVHLKNTHSQATVLMVTNQADYLTQQMRALAQYDPQKILGFGGALDSRRFQLCLKEAFDSYFKDSRVKSVEGYLLGYHNKDMFPLQESIHINHLPLDWFLQKNHISQKDWQVILDRALSKTRDYGAQVARLSRNHEGASIAVGNLLSKAIVRLSFPSETPYVAPFTVLLPRDDKTQAIYGQSGCFFSVPIILQPDGRYSIFYGVHLTPAEKLKAKTASTNFQMTSLTTTKLIQAQKEIPSETLGYVLKR